KIISHTFPHTIEHNTALHHSTVHHTALHNSTEHHTALPHSTVHHTALHNSTEHHTALHHSTEHHTALHHSWLMVGGEPCIAVLPTAHQTLSEQRDYQYHESLFTRALLKSIEI
uniref:Uncharacterized protein n=1 Tax=Electrophorus electricus TaxID=8005 RepID=A0AAY5EHI3_ELEEL